MSRFLFVVLPLAGHVYPASAVADALAERGHEVAWVGPRGHLRPLLGPGATVWPTGMRPYRGQADTGMAAVKSLWDGFVVPFARHTLPAVLRTVETYQPGAVVADQHAFAGALAARRHGLPWATMCTSPIELGRPFRGLPKVEAWLADRVAALSQEAGLRPDEGFDLRFSPYLGIAFTTAALAGKLELPAQLALVGPALGARPPGPPFPWDHVDPRRRHVLVTMGTLAADIASGRGDFRARAVEALRPLGDWLQPIVVAPEQVLPGPDVDVIVTPRAPLLDLMPLLDLVVCHGGYNTVCETLAHGVPLVVAPVNHDQPISAAQVAAAGAGVRVNFSRVSPQRLRAAVTLVLGDPGYRAAAGRIRDSFAAAGGARAAAELIERLPGAREQRSPAAVMPLLAGPPGRAAASASPAGTGSPQ